MNIPNINFGCLFISITSMYLCFKVWEAREAPVEAYMCDLWALETEGSSTSTSGLQATSPSLLLITLHSKKRAG